MPTTTLQIKVNSLKRLLKEKGLYELEVQEQENFVKLMKSNNADEYEIKKQSKVLEESQRMVPEVSKKIAEHKQALVDFLKTYKGDEDTSEAKELIKG